MIWPFRKTIGAKLSKNFTTGRIPARAPIETRAVNDTEADRILKGWKARAIPPVSFTDLYHTKLVGRARDICRNNSYGKAGLRALRQNIVGENGIRLQMQVTTEKGELDKDINAAIEEAWKKFSERQNVDTAGRKNLHALQMSALNALVTDGEFIFRKHNKGTYGVQIQEIDAMRIPPGETNRYLYDKKGQIYKNGIIFQKATDKALYYCLNYDRVNYYEMVPGQHSEKIPAKNIMHGMVFESTGQTRGIPLGQTASETLYMIAQYQQAALQNAEMGARKLGFFKQQTDTPPPTAPVLDENGDPVRDENGNVILKNALDGAKISMKSGSISSLPPGVDFTDWKTEYPRQEFEAFTKSMLRGAAVGFGVPYADLSGDLSDVNYSSMRQGALEIRANYRILQGLLIEYQMGPLFLEWLVTQLMRETLVVNGRTLTVAMLPIVNKPVWTPKRWAWIDPRSEAIANQIAIKTGMKAPSQIIKEMGGDPEEVWQSVKQDIEVMEGIGLPESYVAGIFAQQAASVEDLIKEVYSGSGDTISDMSNQV